MEMAGDGEGSKVFEQSCSLRYDRSLIVRIELSQMKNVRRWRCGVGWWGGVKKRVYP